MPKEKTFILRAGVLLHYNGDAFVNENLTDEIAMDALIDNINRRDLFQKVPDNLDAVLQARKAVKAKEKPEDNVPREELVKQLQALKTVNSELQEKLDGAAKSFEEKEKEIASLREAANGGDEALKKDLEEHKAEIEHLNGVIAEKEQLSTEKDAKIAELQAALEAAAAKNEEKPAGDAAPAAEAPAEAPAAEEAPAEAGKGKAAAAKK